MEQLWDCIKDMQSGQNNLCVLIYEDDRFKIFLRNNICIIRPHGGHACHMSKKNLIDEPWVSLCEYLQIVDPHVVSNSYNEQIYINNSY